MHFPSSDDTLKPRPDTARWLEAQQGQSTMWKVLAMFESAKLRIFKKRLVLRHKCLSTCLLGPIVGVDLASLRASLDQHLGESGA